MNVVPVSTAIFACAPRRAKAFGEGFQPRAVGGEDALGYVGAARTAEIGIPAGKLGRARLDDIDERHPGAICLGEPGHPVEGAICDAVVVAQDENVLEPFHGVPRC